MNKIDLQKLNERELSDLIINATKLLNTTDLDRLPTNERKALKKAFDEIKCTDDIYTSVLIKAEIRVELSMSADLEAGEIDSYIEDFDYDDDEIINKARNSKQIKDIEKKFNSQWKHFNSLVVKAGKSLNVSEDKIIKMLEERL